MSAELLIASVAPSMSQHGACCRISFNTIAVVYKYQDVWRRICVHHWLHCTSSQVCVQLGNNWRLLRLLCELAQCVIAAETVASFIDPYNGSKPEQLYFIAWQFAIIANNVSCFLCRWLPPIHHHYSRISAKFVGQFITKRQQNKTFLCQAWGLFYYKIWQCGHYGWEVD